MPTMTKLVSRYYSIVNKDQRAMWAKDPETAAKQQAHMFQNLA